MASPRSPSIATGRIEIDLGALIRNFELLRRRTAPAECAATVKANAYGHGVEHVVPALLEVGCKTFFVATPTEGATVRALAPDAAIYILDGLLPDTATFYLEHQLRPVIGDLQEYGEWFGRTNEPAALQFDTGMNRSGISPREVQALQKTPDAIAAANIDLVMSHLACGDVPAHPMNAKQHAAFEQARRLFPNARASFANSAAIFGGPQNHFDLVRPGISLYGGRALEGAVCETEPVARVYARVIKVRDNWDIATVGYSATRSLTNSTRLATIAIGYADGLPRHLSAGDGDTPANVWCAGHPAPIVGRISMDMTTIDISSLPEGTVNRGDMVEIFGTNIHVDDQAACAGTMGYELLTQLSTRLPRVVLPTEGSM